MLSKIMILRNSLNFFHLNDFFLNESFLDNFAIFLHNNLGQMFLKSQRNIEEEFDENYVKKFARKNVEEWRLVQPLVGESFKKVVRRGFC